MLGAASSPAPAPEAPPPAHPAPLPPPPRALPPAPAAPALGALQAFLSMGNIKFGSIGRGHLLQRRPRRLLARSRPNWYLHFSGLCPAAAAVAPVGAVWTKCESLKAVRLVWCRLSSGLAARRPPAPLAAAPPAAAVVAATADTAPVAPPKPRWLRALPLPLPPPLASPRAWTSGSPLLLASPPAWTSGSVSLPSRRSLAGLRCVGAWLGRLGVSTLDRPGCGREAHTRACVTRLSSTAAWHTRACVTQRKAPT
mmetsp:Transcript_81241/g.263384  ORF Transcript_81241/g.263384 Transcript_81241/m.263384 type:complete len:254 (+) Transcript_81241:980-1741(+)